MFEKLELTDSKRQDVNGDFLLPIPKGCKFTTEEVPFAPGTRLAIIPEANAFNDEVKDMPFVFCIAGDGATLQNDERFDPAHFSHYVLQILLGFSKDIDGDKQHAFRDGFGIVYNVQDGTAKQSVLKLHGLIFAESTIYQFIMFRIGISSAEKDAFMNSVLDWFGSFRLHGEDINASLAEVVRQGNPYTWKSDYIAVRNDNKKVYAVGKEWELTLPAGVSASVNAKYNATLNGQDETALLVLKGLKQDDGSFLFHFGLQRAMENITLNDCKYDSRFLEDASAHEDTRYGLRVTTSQRAIISDSDDLFVDMINEDMFPFFRCLRILIRVRGKNISSYDFQMCVKKERLDQSVFDKISAKMKELANSITLIKKSAQTSPAKKSASSKKSESKKIINDPKCIMNGTVLDKYIGTEEDIVLPEGITELADGIFSGRTKIRTVVVPETVKKIGYRAFENCYSLQKIALPTNLQSIEGYAFVDCHKLESINLGSRISQIGGSAFSECYEMPDVVIGNKVQEIDAFAFKNCRKIKHFIIPDGVETIGFSAFTNCKELEHLFIPASLKTIKENPINPFLFAGCDKLKIHTPAGSFAEKYAKDHSIPVVTEENPSFMVEGISRAEVLAGIASLPNTAAETSLTEDQQEDEEASSPQAEKWMQENGAYVEKDPTIVFEGKVFVFSGIAMHTVEQEDPIVQAVIKKGGQYRSKVSGLTNYLVVDPRYCGSSKTAAAIEQQRKGKPVKIILLEDLKAILSGKAKSTKKATSTSSSASKDIKTTTASSSKKNMLETKAATEISRDMIPKLKGALVPLSDLTIKDGIVKQYKGKGKDIILPDGIRAIGKNAFFFNKNLRSIVIPEGVTRIGEGAFIACSALRHVSLPSTLETIEESAFRSCTSLNVICIPAGVKKIGAYAFWFDWNLMDIFLPESIKSIGSTAFQSYNYDMFVHTKRGSYGDRYCKENDLNIDYGSFDEYVPRIPRPVTEESTAEEFCIEGDELLHYSGRAKLVVVPDMVRKIHSEAFRNNLAVERIIIPTGIQSFGYSVFSECEKLESIVLNSATDKCPDFSSCKSLVSLCIPYGVKEIGGSTFMSCDQLKDLYLPPTITSIDRYAFISSKTVCHVAKGSYAEQYAKEARLLYDNKIDGVWKEYDDKLKQEQALSEQNEKTYQQLIEKSKTARTVGEWSSLASRFMEMNGYKDSQAQAKVCVDTAAKLQKQIDNERQRELEIREERRKEQERVAREQKRNRLETEKKEQEAILQQNKGVSALFGEKAKKRKAAQARIAEIEEELSKLK